MHTHTHTNVQVSKKPSSPAGSLLCGALLKAYEGAASSLLSERWLIGKSLSLLLACSVSAKQTGLKGERFGYISLERQFYYVSLFETTASSYASLSLPIRWSTRVADGGIENVAL